MSTVTNAAQAACARREVVAVNAARARENLDAAVREQLREAWERGLAAAPHGPPALADAGAPAGFSKVSRAADDYAAAIADTWRRP